MVRRSHTAMPSSTVLVAEDIVGLDVEMVIMMIVMMIIVVMIVMMIVMIHLVSTIMIRELKTIVTTISRGITTP